jgi:uncharacterized protein (TIGR02145 family)
MKTTKNLNHYFYLGLCVIFFGCGVGNGNKEGVKTEDSLANADMNKTSTIVDSTLNNTKEYKAVTISNQTWMVENLNVNVFLNGDTIPEAKSVNDWISASKNEQAAWCYYDNTISDGQSLGKLYNWYAVNDKRGLVPEGWRVPSKADFSQLIENMGGEKLAGAKLKSVNIWSEKGKGTNESGFTALPSGMRQFNGGFSNKTDYSYLWSSTDRVKDNAWYFGLSDKNAIAKTFFSQKGNGFSIRCIKK